MAIPYKMRKRIFCNINSKREYDKRNLSEYQKYHSKCQFDFSLNQHPANCNLLKHNENVSKYKSCSITLDELLTRIKMWNIKYGALTQSA